MLGRTGVGFQGRGFESHRGDSTTLFTPNDYAARQRNDVFWGSDYTKSHIAQPVRCRALRFKTRTLHFSIFHFSLFSWNSHWRMRALMSIRFQSLLIVHLLEEDARFLETCLTQSRKPPDILFLILDFHSTR